MPTSCTRRTDIIFMHVPGDNVGSLTISGLAFSGLCRSGRDGFGENMTGFERVLLWYRENRDSNPMKNSPIEVVPVRWCYGFSKRRWLLGVFQTLKQQNANVTKTIVNALHQFLTTKKLPTLKQPLENSPE